MIHNYLCNNTTPVYHPEDDATNLSDNGLTVQKQSTYFTSSFNVILCFILINCIVWCVMCLELSKLKRNKNFNVAEMNDYRIVTYIILIILS